MGQDDDLAARCAAIARVNAGNGDLGAAITDVHRLPAGLPARGLLAAGLVEAVLRRNPMIGVDLRLLDRLDASRRPRPGRHRACRGAPPRARAGRAARAAPAEHGTGACEP